MPEDFSSAAVRHFDDAHLLLSEGRYDNAAYLAGYVAECTLKILLGNWGGSAKAIGHELGTISAEGLYLTWIVAPAVRRYVVPKSPELDDLIKQWRPEMRYSPSGNIGSAQASQWLEAARQLITNIVVEAALDGWGEQP